jgi:hypothetical protein
LGRKKPQLKAGFSCRVLVRPLDSSQFTTKKLNESLVTTWADNTDQWNGDVL